MQVVKRNGRREEVKFDKIIDRVKLQSRDLEIDAAFLAQQVIQGFHDGISTKDIDSYLAETAAVLSTEHYNYAKLAARIAISCLHKETSYSFAKTTEKLFKAKVISHEYYVKSKTFGKEVEELIDYKRDFDFDYFGFKTLERSYLLKVDQKIVERPQHLFMRVALEICDNVKEIKSLYECLSKGIYTHATPTLFNAGTNAPQLSSCYLVAMQSDSIEGIFDTLKDCALISKYAGGIGLHIHNIRAKNALIKGTNGRSSGIVPLVKVFNETARYVDQAGRRKGAMAIYLEPWHEDVEDFLELKKPTGKDELRARDIFLALWIPDLFMQRVKEDKVWSLFSPDLAMGLSDCYGEKFKEMYERYELTKPCRRVRARDIWKKIIESQLESGVPYILFKDACNEKSNQKNLGTIKSSNLCVEILEYSNQHETAVCNLASICLPKFVKNDNTFDFKIFHEFVKIAVKNLDKVIDKNYYPTKKTETSNFSHRPIGLGVQGLCDVFFQMGLTYESDECKALDEKIFAAMYYAAIEASCELAQEHGPYKTFKGSPASQGFLQFDLWKKKGHSDFDWKKLRNLVSEHGLRNSLLVALMPTASTSQIFGNTECFELPTSNLYKRQTLSGEFVVVNKYLVRQLQKLGIWNAETREQIIANNGSIQNIETLPDHIKRIYQTAWEVKQRHVIDHAAIRAPYICQSQSMNLFFAEPSAGVITSALFYAWEKGLKTGCYYTRTRPAANAAKVTTKIVSEEKTPEQIACSLENPESCVMCQ